MGQFPLINLVQVQKRLTVDAYRVKCLKSPKKKIIAVANLQIIWSETLVACSIPHYQYLASGAQHFTLQRCPVV